MPLRPVRDARARLGVAAVISLGALLLLGLPGEATASAGATTTATAPMILTPSGDAVFTRSQIRVVVRSPANASRTRVRIGDRDVTGRFRAEGRRLVGRLALRDGLRYGRNELVVVAHRMGKVEVRQARSFFLVRRMDGFVRVKLRRRKPAHARIDIVSGGPLVQLRRRPRDVRVRLNGRVVTKAVRAPTGTRRTISLSATHGLRYGVNRLRVFVAEPQHGRYASITRRFVVGRDGPLAAAGRDRGARPRARIRVGGRGTAARGGRLRYRWTLVRRPKGSRAQIAGRTRARPLLVPDRPGRYVLRQRISEHSRTRGSAARVGSFSFDDVSVVANPPSALFALSANAFPVDPRGIKVGDTFYHHPGPGATIQWLMLDRATLTPTKSGNTWCCGDGANSLATLTDTLGNSGIEQLVILTLPPNRQTLPPDQFDEFNKALDMIGVDPLDATLLEDQDQQFVVVGIPSAGEGSGWTWRRGASTEKLPAQGWLMPDGDLSTTSSGQLFRFQPLRLTFDTSSHSTANPPSNTMTIAGQSVSASLPDSNSSGFQVVEVDPRDLSIVSNNTFVTAGLGLVDPFIRNYQNMVNLINAAHGRSNYVAVQGMNLPSPRQIPPGGRS